MSTIKFHQNGEISVRMSKELARKIALSMGSVYDEIGVPSLENYPLQAEACELHHNLNNNKIWRNK